MIVIERDRETGNTFITRGSCKLFIIYASARNLLAAYRFLANPDWLDSSGRGERTETSVAVGYFEYLKNDIIRFGHRGCHYHMGTGLTDTVTYTCLELRVQDLAKESVLA